MTGPSRFSRDFTMRKIGRANGPLHRLCLVKNVRRRKEHAGTENVGSKTENVGNRNVV